MSPCSHHHPRGRCATVAQRLRRGPRLVTIGWVFGSVWQTTVTGAPLTLFAASLHASQFQFGLLAALPFIGSLVSIPASFLIERTGARKHIFLWSQYPNRFIWLTVALIPLYMVQRHGDAACAAAMSIFLWLMFVMHSGNAVAGTAWTAWMADVVPDRKRGKYFSRRRQWGILSAIPTALLAGYLLDRLGVVQQAAGQMQALTKWCALIILGSGIFGFFDVSVFHWIPDHRPSPRRVSLMSTFVQPMRDRQFMLFGGFVGMLTFAVSFMTQFATLFLIEKLNVSNMQVQLVLVAAPMIAQLVVLPAWGKAADRMGKKPVLAIAAIGLIPVGFGWCFCGRDHLWLGYLLSAAGAALWIGIEVANLNYVLERAANSEGNQPLLGGSNYIAVNTAITNIAGCFGGLSAGLLAQMLGSWHWNPGIPGIHHDVTAYEALFAASGVLRLLAAVIFLPLIHEPTARSTREAFRFMAGSICSSAARRIASPLRRARAELEAASKTPYVD